MFETVGYVLLNFMNTSLRTGRLPKRLNVTTVVPIQKVANTNASDFRTINTLPPIKKIVEIVVYEQLIGHVDRHSILINNQSGFRQGYSYKSAIRITLNKIEKDIDNNKYVIGIFLDLKRAFVTVQSEILLHKLL